MNRPFVTAALSLLPLTAAAAQEGGSTFGHARTRELAELGVLPGARDVVVRDIVNYHRHRLPLPRAGQAVALDVRFDRAAAAPGDEVWLQVGYTTAPQGDRAMSPPVAVALVVDVSGSMAAAGKITAVQAGLRAFADSLRADDDVALVTFATTAELAVPLRSRGDGRWLHDAIERLSPGGNTNLHDGLMLGLDELRRGGTAAGARRVIVLTDGIANTGVTAPDRILADTVALAEHTVDVATIGVGENLDAGLLQRLATGCRGSFHFVADAADVHKVFVAEADALLHRAARAVRLAVELPEQLRVLHVPHEGARVGRGRITLDLPDLDAGATGVVMVRCVVDGRARAGEVHAELAFDDACSHERRRERAMCTLAAAERDYRVREGDSFERIARTELGSAERWTEIAGANPDVGPERIRPGQRLRLPPRATPDLEVRKNAAIAVLAQGLADMARACDARRWADADAALRCAQDDATVLFPGTDEDVQRVRDVAAGHARTLRRHVDRFRDH